MKENVMSNFGENYVTYWTFCKYYIKIKNIYFLEKRELFVV